ncbi:hypothetical protein LTR53_014799, partial [Teratosphaeriaceae sp. CCFEE 6253]
MQSLLSRHQHDSSVRAHFALPLLLLLSSILSYLGTPSRHFLLSNAIAWLSICAYLTLRIGAKGLLDAAPSQKLAWTAGALLALAAVEERALGGSGLWWAKALLPLTLFAIGKTDVFTKDTAQGADSPTGSDKLQGYEANTPSTPLFILTASAIAAVHVSSGSNAALSIGLSHAVFTALALRLIESARAEAARPTANGSVMYSANGFLAQPDKPTKSDHDLALIVLRDVAAAALVGTAVAAVALEAFSFDRGLTYKSATGEALVGQAVTKALYALVMVMIQITMLIMLASLVLM